MASSSSSSLAGAGPVNGASASTGQVSQQQQQRAGAANSNSTSASNAVAAAAPQPASSSSSTTTTANKDAVTQPQQQQPPSSSGANPSYKPLNVKDALSYLDQVKNQFNRKPEIYNRFLDIMKDFKTQQIDTPGVIDRVSNLFRGHPQLIQGFNTFLPPGYRIDCSFDPADSGLITVTTPSGITRRVAEPSSSSAMPGPPGSGQPLAMAARPSPSGQPAPSLAGRPPPSSSSVPAAASAAQSTTTTINNLPARLPTASQQQQPSSSNGAQTSSFGPLRGNPATSGSSAATAAGMPTAQPPSSSSSSHAVIGASGGTGSTSSSGAVTPAGTVNVSGSVAASGGDNRARQPAEFNHAINFVNKIKNRFQRRPDTYKAFLEILQTYQKEQRAIQDVYAQVTVLFREAPDLLEEFKEFLPDTSAASPGPAPGALQAPSSSSSTTLPLAPASQAPPSQPAGAASAAIPAPSAAVGSGSSMQTASLSHLQSQSSQTATSAPVSMAPPAATVANRTARNSATTSLFGVNASGTSQPQPGQTASYLGAKDRKGQVIPTASLDATASRKPQIPQNQLQQSQPPLLASHTNTLQQSTAAAGAAYDRQDASEMYDETWQPTSATKKRRGGGGADKPRKRGKVASSSQLADESPDETMLLNGYQQPALQRGLSGAASYQQIQQPGQPLMPPPVQPIILPHALRPHGPRNQLQHLVNNEELILFDRIKRHVEDKAVYGEFLKLLNLYTQEIIDMPTLLEKAFLYIGGSDEIFGLFREFVGEQDGFVEGEEWPIDNAPALERERFELYSLKSYGPSYRKLPYSESKGLACSGRDALCWSVLNDDWVAYATWASEGSGAHRKNAYEDALASSEQERHWYDYNIESNLRSIAVLEPIVMRISLMTPEEKAAFRLKPGLGGQSSSFYERIIKKIYGRDHGLEAIQALYDSPAIAAPIILNRLKQKDEEWKRALREWNKVWREVDAKNYYRSLDHQGLTFKTNDKKMTTSKNLLAEIESLKREQQQKRVSLASNSATTPCLRPRHQFEMQMDDYDVLFDVLKLTFSFIDRATTTYSSKERIAIEATLRRMVPMIFSIDEKFVEANLAPAIQFELDGDNATEAGDSEDDSSAGGGTMSDEHESSGSGKKGFKRRAADLRKKLLTSSAAMNGAAHSSGQGARDDATDAEGADGETDGEADPLPSLEVNRWIEIGYKPWPARSPEAAGFTANDRKRKAPSQAPTRSAAIATAQQAQLNTNGERVGSDVTQRYNFYASQPFYCFIRLFHMLYHRLATLKQETQEIVRTKGKETRLNPLAVELGLAVPHPFIDDPSMPRGKNYYEYMLELCEKYFELEIDSQTFEENLRYMWGIKAFPAFTIDKVIASMTKHVHAINQDTRCQQLLDLLARSRERPMTTTGQQIVYRHACEDIIGHDENLFRLEWIPSAKALGIQLLAPDELTLDDALEQENGEWKYYIDSYALDQATEGLAADAHAPLLQRNRDASDDVFGADNVAVVKGRSDLAIRIAPHTYKISYLLETEETIYRTVNRVETGKSAAAGEAGSVPVEGGEKAEGNNASADGAEQHSLLLSDEAIRMRRKEAWEKWLEAQTAPPPTPVESVSMKSSSSKAASPVAEPNPPPEVTPGDPEQLSTDLADSVDVDDVASTDAATAAAAPMAQAESSSTTTSVVAAPSAATVAPEDKASNADQGDADDEMEIDEQDEGADPKADVAAVDVTTAATESETPTPTASAPASATGESAESLPSLREGEPKPTGSGSKQGEGAAAAMKLDATETQAVAEAGDAVQGTADAVSVEDKSKNDVNSTVESTAGAEEAATAESKEEGDAERKKTAGAEGNATGATSG